jgi:hypothetical protein
MDRPPPFAQVGQVQTERLDHPFQAALVEAPQVPQLWGTIGAVEQEHRLAAGSDNVNVRGSVIMRVDGHAQAIEAENGRHGEW